MNQTKPMAGKLESGSCDGWNIVIETFVHLILQFHSLVKQCVSASWRAVCGLKQQQSEVKARV